MSDDEKVNNAKDKKADSAKDKTDKKPGKDQGRERGTPRREFGRVEFSAPDGVALRIGQVWIDMDKRREEERRLTIIALMPVQGKVMMRVEDTGRNVAVSVARLRPGSTGYKRIVD